MEKIRNVILTIVYEDFYLMAKRKKVAIIVNSLYGGGMERVAAQLSILLSDFGYDVYILVNGFNKRSTYRYKGKIIVLPQISFKSNCLWGEEIIDLFYSSYQVAKIKRQYGIDITISFAPPKNLINMLSGTKDKKILTIHSCLSQRKDLKGISYIPKIFKWYNYADKVIAVSKWCKKDLICNYGIKKNKVEVIYNPVENPMQQCMESITKNIILVVGRMHDIKQQWHIIRAFKNVLEEIPDAELIFAGKGDNAKYLRKLCYDLNIENNVLFKGFVNEINTLYYQAKCVVFSSASEAFPCSVIEAMSHGVPVVAADCPGGIREIIAGRGDCLSDVKEATIVEGGVLTPRLDGIKYGAEVPLTKAEHEMAKGILYILNNEPIRSLMMKNCLEISKLFDEKRIAKKWLKLMR